MSQGFQVEIRVSKRDCLHKEIEGTEIVCYAVRAMTMDGAVKKSRDKGEVLRVRTQKVIDKKKLVHGEWHKA
jgi:hypothetical protein